NIVSDTSQDQIRVNRAARYTAVLTDASNGCFTTVAIVVPADTVAPLAEANATADLDCFNETVQLSGQGSSNDGINFQYTWSTSSSGTITGGSGLQPTVDAPGWYTITVRDIRNGCIGQDSTEVIENAPPITDAALLNQSPRCYGEENGIIQIENVSGGTPPYLYSLNGQPLQSFGEFNNLPPGVYDILIQDAAGCELDTTITVEQRIQLLIDLGPDVTVLLGDSSTLEALINIPDNEVDTLIWEPEDFINCPGCYIQNVSPPYSTVFAVTLVDINGCRATDEVEVILDKTRPVFIPSGFSPNQDGINDVFMVYGGPGVERVDEFLIFDRWGNLLFQANDFQPNDPAFGWDGRFQGKMMNEAVFVYQAQITFLDGRTEIFKGDVTLVKQ
ncbi:MAG: gliding motility-associated C-terminal domain-containing protein, partial [Saprospiraceae bacterium]|nr:gliding motility-associated C-terminal domain-containing protein [Saprospiraceae bacterium]